MHLFLLNFFYFFLLDMAFFFDIPEFHSKVNYYFLSKNYFKMSLIYFTDTWKLSKRTNFITIL